MNLILVRFLTSTQVPALSNSLKEFSDRICIAYKGNSIGTVHVLTNSPTVVQYLFEINPNCVELTNPRKFLDKEISKYTLTNPNALDTIANASPSEKILN